MGKRTKITAWFGITILILLAASGQQCIDNPECGPTFEASEYYSDFIGPPTIEPYKINMQPGQTQRFSIVRWQCCYITVPATSTPCVQWSIDPSTAGTIDNEGNFQLSADAQAGQIVTVRADFPDLNLSASVAVYTSAANPLVRTWREKAAIPCNSEEENIPGKIEEIIFNADGTFLLTWYPFEVYYDYWGTYSHDVETGQLTMSITSGNYIPSTVDLEGTAQFQTDGSVRLDSIFFGQPPDAGEAQICGHIIE